MALETRPKSVGVLSCSGEEEPEGTIARNAVRLVMEKYQPGITVTLCLPLYVAGDEGEREFARKVPVIAVDGCDKACARRATEKYSVASGGCHRHPRIAARVGRGREAFALSPR